MVKNPPATAGGRRDRLQSLGWEDPLKEEMATHSSILDGIILQTEETGGLQSTGITESDRTEHTCMHAHVGSAGVSKILYLL